LAEEDGAHISFMIEVVKAASVAITNASPPDVYPALYPVVSHGCTWVQSMGSHGGFDPPLRQRGLKEMAFSRWQKTTSYYGRGPFFIGTTTCGARSFALWWWWYMHDDDDVCIFSSS
jgi:hypothetical protein